MWCPAAQGHRRVYSFEDLTEVAVICELRRKGFSLQRMRKVVRFLQKEFSKRLAETVSGSSNYHLLTDGHVALSRNLTPADCGHTEKFPAADVGHMPERHRAPGKGDRQRTQASRALCSGKSSFHTQSEIGFLAVICPPGGEMVAELEVLNEWIPEQMQPGTIFVLENAGQIGEKEDPYWAVLSCPNCGTLGLITRKQIAGLTGCDLRIGKMLCAILYPRQRH